DGQPMLGQGSEAIKIPPHNGLSVIEKLVPRQGRTAGGLEVPLDLLGLLEIPLEARAGHLCLLSAGGFQRLSGAGVDERKGLKIGGGERPGLGVELDHAQHPAVAATQRDAHNGIGSVKTEDLVRREATVRFDFPREEGLAVLETMVRENPAETCL